MFKFTLPQRTQVIGGRSRNGKSFTALSLASTLSNKDGGVLFITDNYDSVMSSFEDYSKRKINLIPTSFNSHINFLNYKTVILDIHCYFTDIEKMELESYYELSPKILSYLKSINDQTQIPFVVITANLSKDLLELIKY